MVSIAERKLAYCAKHWLDLAIIALPLVAFLRASRLVRVAGLVPVAEVLKVYCLRGLTMRVYRGLVVLNLVGQLIHRSPERRLRHLRARVREKEWELEQLRAEVRATEQALRANAEGL